MEQIGVVVKEDGEHIEILAVRESACGSDCSTCSAKCSESKPFNIKTINTINAKVGDRVRIEMNSKAVLSYMVLIYGLPLVFFMAGSVIFFSIFKNLNYLHAELYSLIAGLLVMSVAYLIIKKVDNKYGKAGNNNLVLSKF